MPLINMKDKRNKAFVDVLLQKAKKPAQKAKTSVRGGGSLIDRIKNIESMVQSKLGHYKDELMLVQTEEDLHAYIDKAIENGNIAIDTETTGLDPFTCHIVGVCLYTPGMKSCYIPMYHTSYISRQRVPNQLDNETVAKELQRLIDNNVKTIFFNAKFDIRMMRASLGIYMTPYWDGFIAGKCLKENETEASLKYLWKKYCSPDKDAAHFTFDKFFKGIQFDLIPIHTAYLYAAMDTKMTYELYKFQEPYLTPEDEKCQLLDMTRLAKLYREIEMPIITVIADIEDRGVYLNVPLAKQLSEKYHAILDEQLNKFYEELNKHSDQLNSYLATHPQTKLENPINIGSPAQLAELLYDVLKIDPPDKRNPRGTGEDILKAMKLPLCNLILDYRGTQKLLSTYIDKLPESRNANTHKIHAAFLQYGADTGRFASRDPNLQNIPSHEKIIRTLFISCRVFDTEIKDNKLDLLWGDVLQTPIDRKFVMDLKIGDTIKYKDGYATITNIEFDGDLKYIVSLDKQMGKIRVYRLYCLFGGDFSQQEPKLTADLSNDEKFIQECASGKDAYGTVASLAFNKPYEECLEFYLDENGKKTDRINKEGKERRTQAKSILLGLIYGRTIETIAEQLGCSKEKAEQIKESVFTGIKGLRNLINESCEMARQLGYVEDKWGRRRHIPDMQLEPYEVEFKGTKNFDPFFDSEELGVVDDGERLRQSYIKQLKEAKYKQQKDSIKMKAEKDGFKVHEHTRKIADAERQCTNSRVQGSAATQCKIAINNVATNKTLQDLDFHMILLVHDEIIGEAPLVNIQKVAPIFQQCLLDSAKDLRTGAKCDCAATLYWYADQFEDEIHIDSLTKENMKEIIKKAPFIFEGDL